ncbi:LOW QUALITY PROTEIN: hypothetical protein HID58_028390 [Brassica napus]|uniref:Uncharacterized protein n=1 Tax=Brassica napus TaxID=3708 RepID=A0ABQ8CA47_BRANA|nr:LOW QUALITY PROTEIN: hypothetical protein HID58_028390 [Brassica napus]
MLLSKQHGREINGWALVHLEIQEKKDSWWQSFIISVHFPFLHLPQMEVTDSSEICGRISQKRRDCLRKRHRKQPRYINPKDWETILSTYEAKSKSQSAASSRTSAPEGKRCTSMGRTMDFLPILSIIIDEGLEEPPSCPDLVRKTHTHADGSFIDKSAEALVMETEHVVEEMMTQDGSPVGESQPCSTSGTITSKCLLLNQEYIKGEIFYGLGSVQFKTTTTSQFVPALPKRSLDMEMRMCGIETTTDEVKADLNAFKSDFKEEMAAKRSTLNMILQVLQPQASVPPASTTQATQPHPDRQAQAPSPAHVSNSRSITMSTSHNQQPI